MEVGWIGEIGETKKESSKGLRKRQDTVSVVHVEVQQGVGGLAEFKGEVHLWGGQSIQLDSSREPFFEAGFPNLGT